MCRILWLYTTRPPGFNIPGYYSSQSESWRLFITSRVGLAVQQAEPRILYEDFGFLCPLEKHGFLNNYFRQSGYVSSKYRLNTPITEAWAAGSTQNPTVDSCRVPMLSSSSTATNPHSTMLLHISKASALLIQPSKILTLSPSLDSSRILASTPAASAALQSAPSSPSADWPTSHPDASPSRYRSRPQTRHPHTAAERSANRYIP